MKNSRVRNMLTGLVIGISGCGNYINNENKPDSLEIKNEEECEAYNGVWGRWGLFPFESCNYRTNDFGDRCYDQNQCEGMCITECNSSDCHSESGKCTEFENYFGCARTWHQGRESLGIICID